MPEDEGAYLQGAVPHTAKHGLPGTYATDPSQHHVEGDALDTLQTRDRLIEEWQPWFDLEQPWWLEKSPVNLTRTRLYQSLFPRSHFIIVLRHPQLMAAALRKWSERPAGELTSYGLDAYETVRADLAYLHSAMIVRYEDLVASPASWVGAMQEFLGLERHPCDISIRDGNRDYSPDGPVDPAIEGRLREWGYGPNGRVMPLQPIIHHPLREVTEKTLRSLG